MTDPSHRSAARQPNSTTPSAAQPRRRASADAVALRASARRRQRRSCDGRMLRIVGRCACDGPVAGQATAWDIRIFRVLRPRHLTAPSCGSRRKAGLRRDRRLPALLVRQDTVWRSRPRSGARSLLVNARGSMTGASSRYLMKRPNRHMQVTSKREPGLETSSNVALTRAFLRRGQFRPRPCALHPRRSRTTWRRPRVSPGVRTRTGSRLAGNQKPSCGASPV